jgi:hypothetical protein
MERKIRLRKAGISAALLLGVPLLPWLVLKVPFATTFTVMAFLCIMRILLDEWPRDPLTGERRYRRFIPFPRLFGLIVFIAAWSTQPHFGANICPLKGFMWTTDFVEEIRPTIHKKIRRQSGQGNLDLPDGVTLAQFLAVADQAVDLLKQCVAERGVNYCRYAGPDRQGTMMDARTIDGPNAIEREDEYRYRYLKPGIDYDISTVHADTGEIWLTIQV